MATFNPSSEANDSRMSRKVEEGSTAGKFTTVNGNKVAASPPQTTSFRPDPSALSHPYRQQQQALPRQPPLPEGKSKPLFVDLDETKSTYHDESSFRSPENHSNRIGKRKRSTETFEVSPEFTSPPTRREETLNVPAELRSPTRSLPPLLQFQESE
ncbi:hypothetical protein KCU98_g21134, partial [Aureobasidium melanogenum]